MATYHLRRIRVPAYAGNFSQHPHSLFEEVEEPQGGPSHERTPLRHYATRSEGDANLDNSFYDQPASFASSYVPTVGYPLATSVLRLLVCINVVLWDFAILVIWSHMHGRLDPLLRAFSGFVGLLGTALVAVFFLVIVSIAEDLHAVRGLFWADQPFRAPDDEE